MRLKQRWWKIPPVCWRARLTSWLPALVALICCSLLLSSRLLSDRAGHVAQAHGGRVGRQHVAPAAGPHATQAHTSACVRAQRWLISPQHGAERVPGWPFSADSWQIGHRPPPPWRLPAGCLAGVCLIAVRARRVWECAMAAICDPRGRQERAQARARAGCHLVEVALGPTTSVGGTVLLSCWAVVVVVMGPSWAPSPPEGPSSSGGPGDCSGAPGRTPTGGPPASGGPDGCAGEPGPAPAESLLLLLKTVESRRRRRRCRAGPVAATRRLPPPTICWIAPVRLFTVSAKVSKTLSVLCALASCLCALSKSCTTQQQSKGRAGVVRACWLHGLLV